MNDRRIRELVDEGAVDLLDIASATGAGSFCGGCQPAIASVISGCTGEPASALLDRAPSRVSEDTPALPTRVLQVIRTIEDELPAFGDEVGTPVDAEAELAGRFGVSRGTVRDAVAVLAAHGRLRPTREGFVAGPPYVDAARTTSCLHLASSGVAMSEVLEVRRVLERLAVRCACVHPDPDGISWFRRAHADGGAGTSVHADVAGATGNPVLVLLLAIVHELAGPEADSAGGHAEIAAAVIRGDGEEAHAALEAHLAHGHDDAPSVGVGAVGAIGPSSSSLEIATAVADLISADALAPGDVLGTEREVADRLGVDRRVLLRAVPLLEHHAVATRQPGPRATLGVATPDPWPALELLAQALEWSGAEPGQLLHVRQALEGRAVELASASIDRDAAERLRRRLDEEADAVRREHLRDRVFHTIHPVLASLSGNRVLAHLAIALNLALLRRANRDPDLARFLASSVGELTSAHTAIVEATTRGDATTGRRLVDEHGARHAKHRR